MEWDNKGEEKWGSFLRFRVLINLEKPLKKGTFLKSKEGIEFKVCFKFERLLDFCYRCGRVGHLIKDCWEKAQGDDGESETLTYGSWLRASPLRGRQKETRDGRKNLFNCKMIFKPENNENGQSQVNEKANLEMDGSHFESGKIREKSDKCSGDLYTRIPSNEFVLSKDQANLLAAILESLSDWHTTPRAVELRSTSEFIGDIQQGAAMRLRKLTFVLSKLKKARTKHQT